MSVSKVYSMLPHALGQDHPTTMYGEVSHNQPLPQSFSDPLYYVLPDADPNVYYTIDPDSWPASQGNNLPQAGAPVLIVVDNRGNHRCVWWAGLYEVAPQNEPGDLITSAASTRAGCLLCDGSSYATTAHPALFAAIGYAYGGASGTFHVPDLRGRAPIGAGTGSTLTARTLGQTGGEETHLLAVAEMPSHGHGVNDPTHGHPLSLNEDFTGTGDGRSANFGYHYGGSPDNNIPIGAAATGITIQSQGGGGAHNNMQPFVVVNWFIKT